MSFEVNEVRIEKYRENNLKTHFDEAFEWKDLKNKIFTLKSTSGLIFYDP